MIPCSIDRLISRLLCDKLSEKKEINWSTNDCYWLLNDIKSAVILVINDCYCLEDQPGWSTISTPPGKPSLGVASDAVMDAPGPS